VVPGTTYLVTKKTVDDQFLLEPSEELNRLLLFVLLLKGLRYGVRIHDFCFLSNHFHLVVTDVRGELPAFMREFLTDSSKAIQVLHGERRQIWSRRPYNAVSLLDLDAAERKAVYVRLNPMRAGLTEPGEWPGLTSVRWRWGEVITVKRPGFYFSKRYRPEEVSMELAPLPPAYLELEGEAEAAANAESVARTDALIDAESKEIRKTLRRAKQTLAGAEKVRKTRRNQRSQKPVTTIVPRFATRDRARLKEAIAEERAFEEAHEKALEKYRAGHHRTVFPAGTYGYRKLLGVRVAKRGTAA